MKMIRILLLILLFPALTFAQYKVVLKNGKVIEGKFLHEDESNIYIESDGIQMNFKKDQLDLEKMKSLNPSSEVPPTAQSAQPTESRPDSTKTKKPARVYTTEDLQRMKQIWDEDSPQTAPSTQTEPTEPTAEEEQPEVPETQSQPAEETGPRDEKTIREEIELTKTQIVETEKKIEDLRSKNRVVGTWEKMLAKQQQKVKDLQAELKASIAARKAGQTQPQQ